MHVCAEKLVGVGHSEMVHPSGLQMQGRQRCMKIQIQISKMHAIFDTDAAVMEATANMREDERPDDGEVEMNSTMIRLVIGYIIDIDIK